MTIKSFSLGLSPPGTAVDAWLESGVPGYWQRCHAKNNCDAEIRVEQCETRRAENCLIHDIFAVLCTCPYEDACTRVCINGSYHHKLFNYTALPGKLIRDETTGKRFHYMMSPNSNESHSSYTQSFSPDVRTGFLSFSIHTSCTFVVGETCFHINSPRTRTASGLLIYTPIVPPHDDCILS